MYLSRYEGEELEGVLRDLERTNEDVEVIRDMVNGYRKVQGRLEAVLCVLGALARSDGKDDEALAEEYQTQQLLDVMVLRWSDWEHLLDRAQRWIEREERKRRVITRRWSL